MLLKEEDELNKRKPDEEYANINMSYINAKGEKVVVYCPESKYSEATQNPRKADGCTIPTEEESNEVNASTDNIACDISTEVKITKEPKDDIIPQGPQPKSLDIRHGDTGYSYDNLFAEYLDGAKNIELQEPYLSNIYQLQNLTRFAEMIVKLGTCKKFSLTTKTCESIEDTQRLQTALEQLKAALADMGVEFEYTFSDLIHARFIQSDNGWNISLDRGLHIYQAPAQPKNYFLMGSYDLELRPCKETKIIYTRTKE